MGCARSWPDFGPIMYNIARIGESSPNVAQSMTDTYCDVMILAELVQLSV